MSGWFEAHCVVSTEDAQKWPAHGTAAVEEIGEMFGNDALAAASALRDVLPDGMYALDGPVHGPFTWKENAVRYSVTRPMDRKGLLLQMDAMEKQG